MKNEIGRKLTSLTIMAIMFAGLGIVQGVPAFMPGASADFSETDGMLSVSSVYIQGGAILEIVVNDPSTSATDEDVSNGPEVDIDGASYITSQATNGKWYVYAVDDSISTLLDADSDGMEYGIQCTTGIGVQTGPVNGDYTNTKVVGTSSDGTYDIWAEAQGDQAVAGAGGCLELNNASGTSDDTAGTTGRALMSAAVLQDAPSLSNWKGAVHNSSLIDWGQRGHGLNESGYGTWPYILAIEFPSEFDVEYGSDAITVEFGNTDDQTSISLLNQSPSDETHLHLTITDPGLNIDPTAADVWTFDLSSEHANAQALFFSNNHTDTNGGNTAISLSERGDMQCSENCKLGNATTIIGIVDGSESVVMTESGDNTGVFESWSTNSTSQLITVDEIAGDSKVVFTYGGNSVDMIITYNDASITLDAGDGDWVSGETAYVTLVDPDMNKYPGDAETLSIGDEDAVIPTIKIGSPLTLANSDGNNNLEEWNANNVAGVIVGGGTLHSATTTVEYTLGIDNTTDNSERLRILHSAEATSAGCGGAACIGGSQHSHTWINVTTAHSRVALLIYQVQLY